MWILLFVQMANGTKIKKRKKVSQTLLAFIQRAMKKNCHCKCSQWVAFFSLLFLCLCYEWFKHATKALASIFFWWVWACKRVWYFYNARLFCSANNQTKRGKMNPHLFLFFSLPLFLSFFSIPCCRFKFSCIEFIFHQQDFVADMS